nr:unnamed protein product [Callosobruchus chinensis]
MQNSSFAMCIVPFPHIGTFSSENLVETSKSDKYFFGKNFVADLKATDAAKKCILGPDKLIPRI